MLHQGSGESGIGVQTATQQCQAADGRLGVDVGPLVSHREEKVRRWRAEWFLKSEKHLRVWLHLCEELSEVKQRWN